MTSLDDREKALENKFKHDEELRFKINAKAVRLFGIWAASQLGMTGEKAESYAEAVLDADFDEPGIQDFIRKVKADLEQEGKDYTHHHLENEFKLHLDTARKAYGV